MWWAGSFDSRRFLARAAAVRARARRHDRHRAGRPRPSTTTRSARSCALQADAGGSISLERSTLAAPEYWVEPPDAAGRAVGGGARPRAGPAVAAHVVPDITADSHESRVASEPEERTVDGRAGGAADADRGSRRASWPSSRCCSATGRAATAFGTFVHTVFEAADFAAPDLDAELAEHVGETMARRPVELGDRAAAIAGLRAAMETPLGPLVDDVRLRDVPRSDRLDELNFELPLAGGDAPVGTVTPSAIGAVLRAPSPGRRSARGLRGPAERPGPARRGARLPRRAASTSRCGWTARSAVVDYKTNWLAAPGEPLTAWHYRPAALAAEMERAHYGLQALLYTVALHRYLRWRLAGLRPGDAPGRRAVPVHPRHDRRGHARGRRAAVRRLRLAPAGRARGRAATGCWRTGRERAASWTRSTAAAPCARDGLLRAVQRHRRCWRPPTSTSRCGWPRWRARPTRRSCWRPRSRSARRGTGTSSWTWRRSRETAAWTADEEVDLSDAAVAGRRTDWLARLAASPLVAVGEEAVPEPAAAARRHRRCTWIATGARSARSRRICSRSAPRRRSTPTVLEAGLDRLFAGGPDDSQRAAAEAAVRRRFAVVAGGPGTGKTTTVARIVALLVEQSGGRAAAGRAGRADGQGGAAAGGGRAREAAARPALRRGARVHARPRAPRRCTGCSAARPGTNRRSPPPRQPAPARGRDRRRDLDGLAVDDGAAGRGGAAGGAARCWSATRTS